MPIYYPNLNIAVAATDSAVNLTPGDVIGSKLDRLDNGGSSIYAVTYNLEEHFHSDQLVAPALAAAVTVTAAAGAWGYGNLSNDILAAGFVPGKYDVHGLAISAISANDEYELSLVKTYGGVDTVVMAVSFVRESPQVTSMHIPVQTRLLEAGARLRAKLASLAGGGRTCKIKVRYHVY